MRLKIFEKIRERLTPKKDVVGVPARWVKKPGKVKGGSKVKKGIIEIEHKQPRKWRIPFFRPFKRLLAFICMIFNFIVSQFTWTSDPRTQAFAVIFLLNTFLMADYLWKTRKPKEVFT